MNTFRDRLQAVIEQLQACYDEIGVLRDYANSEAMKAPLNKARGLTMDAWGPLQQLDNELPKAHANMVTRGAGLCKPNS